MGIRELKKQIEFRNLSNDMIIFEYKDNKFLCYQYINEIAKIKKQEKIFIKTIEEILTRDTTFLQDGEHLDYLYILDIEELTHDINVPNLIIVCKKVVKNLKLNTIKIPTLTSWQIEDYATLKLPGLSQEEIKWLVSISKNDIYRVDNEINKLIFFSKSNQKALFELMKVEEGYSDLSNLNIFNFTNAFIRKDMNTINEVLKTLNAVGVEAFGLIGILIKQFKNLIDIQMNPKATPEDLKLTPRQFKAISYNRNKYNNYQLVKIYEFLNDLDSRVKSGNLPLTRDNISFIVYITCKIFSF